MLQDLATSLDIKKDDIRLNPTTQHIEIKVALYPGPPSLLLSSIC